LEGSQKGNLEKGFEPRTEGLGKVKMLLEIKGCDILSREILRKCLEREI
jgi:hypothetical protein